MNKAIAVTGIVLLWIITLLLAFVFVAAGVKKFPDHGGWAHLFATWHFPIWFRYFIGVIEIAAGLLILWPRTAMIAAVMIVIVMLGGMATHVWWGKPRETYHEAIPLALASIVAVSRRRASLITTPA